MKRSMILALVLATSVLCPVFSAEIGGETVLPASPRPAHTPDVAFGNGQYLVVWESGRAEHADIYGCRLDEGGKPLDAKPFLISGAKECQQLPRVSWGKDSWLVVWEDIRNDKDYDIYAARVSADGKVLDPDGLLVAGGGHNQCSADVAWGGENFLVAWRSYEGNRYFAYGARIASEGKLLDAKPLALSPAAWLGDGRLSVGYQLRVDSAGGKWMVGWANSSNRKSGDPGYGEQAANGLCGAVVSADGRVTTHRLFQNREGGGSISAPIAMASNGKDEFIFSWYTGASGGRGGSGTDKEGGALRVSIDGKTLGFVKNGRSGMPRPAAAWDGKGYLLVSWQGFPTKPKEGNAIVGDLIAADGKFEGKLDVVPVVKPGGAGNPPYAPEAAGDGKGNTLVVYERHPADNDPPDATIVVAAKLVMR
jgi:hypothetical protein